LLDPAELSAEFQSVKVTSGLSGRDIEFGSAEQLEPFLNSYPKIPCDVFCSSELLIITRDDILVHLGTRIACVSVAIRCP